MFKNKIPTNRENKLLAQMTTHVVMVIATYRVATIPHDWHTIVPVSYTHLTLPTKRIV